MKEKLGHWEGNLAGSPDMPQGRLFVKIPTTVAIHHHLRYPSNIFDLRVFCISPVRYCGCSGAGGR